MILKKIIFSIIISLFSIFNFNFLILSDAPKALQLGFQDPATPVMEGIIFLYDYIFYFLIFIIFFVLWMLFRTLILFNEKNNKKVSVITQNVKLEVAWTITPAFILAGIGGNSITHLYSAEETMNSSLDVTIIGSQWFWTYEFMVFKNKVSIESHMVETEDLNLGSLRNLEVDNSLLLPIETNIRLLVTSTDVIHSWAVPSLGIKIDSVPGRINEGALYIKRPGTFYGQCSEICGKGHAVMPIVVVGLEKDVYNLYLHYLNIKDTDLLKAFTHHVENDLKISDFLREEFSSKK